jgi:hypothetical protein
MLSPTAGAASSPHLILEPSSLLAIRMFERTRRVQTWIVFTDSFDVCETAIFSRAVRAIATEWHRWVLERTGRIGAIREELAIHLGLV